LDAGLEPDCGQRRGSAGPAQAGASDRFWAAHGDCPRRSARWQGRRPEKRQGRRRRFHPLATPCRGRP